MSEIVNHLRERRGKVWEQAKGLAERVAEENRSFEGEEERQWTELNAELDALDKRIKAVLDGENRAKEAEESYAKLNGKPTERKAVDAQQSNDELRKFFRGEGPRSFEVLPDGKVDFRTLVKGTNAAGGSVVPQSFYDRLVAHLIETSSILQAGATILNTSSGEPIQIPRTTSHSAAQITPENTAIPASEPGFGHVNLGAYKYGVLIQCSRELLSDSGVDLEGYLAMQAGRALGNAFGAHAITGSGTNQPRGLATDAAVGVTGASGNAGKPTADNLIDMFHSVIAPYRNSASARWLLSDTSVATIRKLKDSSNQYLWQPGLQAGAPDVLLGKPVLTDPNVAGTGTGNRSILFGDMSQYFVRLAGGIRFERSDEFAFNSDVVTFRALLRADGALVDLSGAVKAFVGG